MRHASLFSGIGAWDLSAEWLGWENVFQCEIDPFCQKYLRKNFPTTTLYGDIKQFTGEEYAGKIDILSASPPCQAASLAGKRRGTGDDRWLWEETFRVIHAVQPTYAVLENVRGLITLENGVVFDKLLASLESNGYEMQTFCIPACAVQAWHRRDRIWIVAHANGDKHREAKRRGKAKERGIQKEDWTQDISSREPSRTNKRYDTDDRRERAKGRKYEAIPELRGIQRIKDGGIYANIEGRSDLSTPVLCRSYDGIPEGMARVKAFGNAVVPQLAFAIFQAIEQAELGAIHLPK